MLQQTRNALGLHGAGPAPPADNTMAIPRNRPADAQTTTALPPAAGVPAGAVADEEPREHRRWPFVLVAILVLSAIAGVGGWWLAVGRSTHAPSVLRMTYNAAATTLDGAGLHAKRGNEVYSASIAPGRVVSQDPGAGARVHRGATVTLHVSLGPAIVDVPDVTGKTVKAATNALKAVHLEVSKERDDYSATVRKGHVISTDPAAGRSVHAGA